MTTTIQTSKTLDTTINKLLAKDRTRSPLDIASEILDSYDSLSRLKRDILFMTAVRVGEMQRLFTLEPKKPTPAEEALIAENLAHQKWEAALPYGHPERHVKLPNGTRRVWKTLTADEHDACAAMLRERGANCYRQAQLHEDAAMRLRGALV